MRRNGYSVQAVWTSSNKRHVKKLDALIAAEKIKILRRYGLRV